MDIKVGNIVPIGAQIECPTDGEVFYVRAFIYSQTNTLLATRDLIDRGNGRFEDFSFIMPNLDFIIVQYFAYDDDQYINQLEEPCPDTEIYKRLEENLGGGGESIPVSFIGIVQKKSLKGILKQNSRLIGTIKPKRLVGTVHKSYNLKGIITKKSLKGVISCNQ